MDASQPPVLLWQPAGLLPYEAAAQWQQRLADARRAERLPDVLLTLEHPPVYTLGRHADPANVLGLRPDIPVVPTDRGGDVTYHGPGQLVAYPIVRLDDVKGARAHVRALERAVIRTLAVYAIRARHGENEARPGVWVDGAKIAAIGVRVSGGVTTHGLALNVEPRLDDFAGIVPCGIADAGVCSMASLGVTPLLAEVEAVLAGNLAVELGRAVRRALPGELPDERPGEAADGPTLHSPAAPRTP